MINHPQDYSSAHGVHVSHFGVQKTGPTIPVMKANFPGTSLDVKLWKLLTENTGVVSVSDGHANVSCGTNSAGSVKLI